MLVLAFFVLLPLGLLGFEITHSMLVQQELRNITDSAALSGTAAMASAPETDPVTGLPTTYQQREVLAMTTAIQTFEYNSILETAFSTTNVTGNQNPQPPVPQTPALRNAILNVLLLDQNGNQVATGAPASTMTVQAYFTDQPIFLAKLLPIQTQFTLSAISNGGLPQLDLILCMDVSGSMDDQTNIWFINRYWDTRTAANGGQKMVYNPNVARGGVSGHGNMFNVLQPPFTGTQLNVYPPQNLADATYQPAPANTHGFTWSETQPTGGVTWSNLIGLRSNTSISTGGGPTMPEQGMPPGNYDPLNPTSNRGGMPAPTTQDNVGGFTDMVCDMGFPTTVQYNGIGYSFPNVQTAVEAARGNMESAAAQNSACCGAAHVAGTGLPAPLAGYFGAYQTWVLQNASPIASARQSAYNFFNTMNLSANCHFGLVCFSSTPGTSSTSVYSTTTDNIDASYPTGGTGIFPNPMIALNQSNTSAQEFAAVTQAVEGNPVNTPPVYGAAINPLRAEGQTDIADALSQALSQLQNNADYRPAAKRAIVLFTDGVPNLPGGTIAAATTAALAQGTAAGQPGVNIPIYTIGLSQNPALQGQEASLLGDSVSNPGIAYLSGNNAIYVPVTSASQLDQAFQTIARSLCVIQ